MPPVILALATWAGISIGAAYLVVATVVLSAGMAVYGTAQARKAQRDARNDALNAMKDRMTTRVATEAPHRYIYGRAKVGADIVAMFTSGDRDQYKHLVCVHAAHECDAIEEVWVNNALVAGLDASGDPTAGRFAIVPNSEIYEEQKTGPTFNLAYMPRVGSVWAFTGTGANMQPVAVTAVNGRTVTVATTAPVTVSYEMPLRSKMGDAINHGTVPAATNPVVRVQRHLGGASDVADVYLRAVVGDQWPVTAVLRGLCYTVITLDLTHPEFQSGIPPIHAVIRGKKLYDPRDGVTRWSQNPALAILDYLTSPVCGVPMSDLPTAQFITAANVCDEVSPTGGARYTVNGTVTSDQGQASVLESMAQAMAGGLVATTWDVYAGKYIAPVAALVQSDIVGGLSVTPGVSDASVYNGVKGQYIGPENKYVQTDFKPYQNSAYRANDGRDLYTNIDFPFTDSQQRVTNLARIFTEDQRNGFTIRAEFSLKAWPLKVGQRITFTSAVLGHNAKVFRITDKAYSPTSAVQLSLKEDSASIWDYADATVVDSTPNSDLPDPWKIDAPASLSCTSGEAALLRQADGTTVPRIMASWPAMAQANGIQVEVEWRAVQSTAWERTTVSAGETRAYLSPITPGFFYVVRARIVNSSLGVRSNWVATVYQVEVFTATPTVYMYAANKPATPAGAASYLWSNGTFGAAPAGWSLTVPAAPGSGNVTLWAATAAVSDVSDVSSSFDWSQAEVKNIGYAPSAAGMGPAGYSNARVQAFQRKATAPTGTPGAVDYDFTSGTITTATLLNGWQKTIPASDGNPLYVTSASASAAGGTDTIASNEWSGAVVLAYDGGAGTPGLNSATVRLYQRSASATAPALPSASATYTFASGAITGINNGWLTYIPTSGGQYLHTTQATAIAATATDAIPATEWAAVQLMYDAADLIAAKAAADMATTRIASISANGVLDRSEKSAINAEWNAINKKATLLEIQADGMGVSHATLSAKFSELTQYLQALSPAWNDTTKDTNIVRVDFDAKFNNYYEAEIALINAIATKSATAPLAIIGGDNLAANSSFERMVNGVADGFAIYGAAGTGTDTAGEVVSSAAGSGRAGGIGQVVIWANSHTGPKGIFGRISAPGWQSGKKYVVSIYAITTNISSASGLRLNWNTAPASVVALSNPTLSTSWQRYAFLVTWGGVVEPNGGGFISVEYGSGGGNVKFDDLMTVEGELLPGYSTSSAEALSAADVAKAAADAAQADATASKESLSRISADNWLAAQEKPVVILEWKRIADERSGIDTQAANLGIGAERTAYQAAYNSLSNYLPVSWNDLTVDTAIVRTTFDQKFADYYAARQNLLNTITAVLKSIAGQAATTSTWDGVTGPGKPQANATVGAPAGTQVAGVDAATVVANAGAGASAAATIANKPLVNAGADIYSTGGGTIRNLGFRTATFSGGVQPLQSIAWSLSIDSGTLRFIGGANTATVSIQASVSASGQDATGTVTCTSVDANGIVGTDSFYVQAFF